MKGALIAGAALAVIVVAVVIALVAGGVVDLQAGEDVPDRIIVLGTAPDEEGAEIAALALVLERGTRSALVLDTLKPATVPDTSASNARDAYPYVGAAGVAGVLAAQTGGDELPWVVLPAETWSTLVDDAGGIEVDVPADISVYRDGSLVVLQPGKQRLSGREAQALLSALAYVDERREREAVAKQIAASVSALISANRDAIVEAVADRRATSPLTAAELSAFSSAP